MACEVERQPLGVFECRLCSLTAPYSYVGQKPPNTQSIILLEESFVTKDPFTPDKDRFLILGSKCSICGRLVCVGPVGMQPVLLQEILPPLCPGACPRLPSGNSAGLGEKESFIKEAGRPAQGSHLSTAEVAWVLGGVELGARRVLALIPGGLEPQGKGVPPVAAAWPGSPAQSWALGRSLGKPRQNLWPPRSYQGPALPAGSALGRLLLTHRGAWSPGCPPFDGPDPGVVSECHLTLLGPGPCLGAVPA